MAEQPGPGRSFELAFLLAVLRGAGEKLIRWGDDIGGRILVAHAAQLERGREWPGDPDIESTFDFEGSDDPRLIFRKRAAERETPSYEPDSNTWAPCCPHGDICTGCDALGACTRMAPLVPEFPSPTPVNSGSTG